MKFILKVRNLLPNLAISVLLLFFAYLIYFMNKHHQAPFEFVEVLSTLVMIIFILFAIGVFRIDFQKEIFDKNN